VLTALTLTTLALGPVAANDGSLVAGDSVEIPSQTVTFDGTEYRVSTLVQVTRGEPLTARATSPSNVTGVDLYDVDGSLVYDRPASVNESVRFATTYLTPGEYLIVTHDGTGRYHTVQPVVVTSYDTSLSVSPTAAGDGQRQFTVNVTETAQTPPIERVEVVVFRGNETARVPASASSEGTYTGTVDLEPGEYRAYASVTVDDQLVGLSDATTVTVDAQSNESTPTSEATQSSPTAQPTQTTQSSQATGSATPANATVGDGPRDSAESQLAELVGGRVANLLGGPLFVVALLVGTLVLSTAAYQSAYSLRRR
jgi:hypothetical protein